MRHLPGVEIADDALVLTMLPHGEHGAVVRFLGLSRGLLSGYVAGARGRGKRGLLQPGNRVALRLAARREGQLPTAAIEPLASRALIAFAPGPAAALSWLTELTAAALYEAVPHPRLAAALDGLLEALSAGLDGPAMRLAVARYELLLLEEEGFGLDLGRCALGGAADDLAFVSPRTGRAVSRAKVAGAPWAGQLLPLPPALLEGGAATAAQAQEALRLTGHFIARHWLSGRPKLEAVRARLSGTTGEHLSA